MTSQRQINACVEGVALFEDKIFVVCDQLDVISVYRRDSLQLVSDIKVGGLQLPNDLVSCWQSRQLYVADLCHCVWRVSVDDGRVKKWIPNKLAPEDCSPLSLSVTSGKVLVTSYYGDVLSLHCGDGRREACITLPSCSKARHAVLMSSGTLVVCRTSPRHDVIEVDRLGHVIRVCGAELNWPRRLALSAIGDVIILDSSSSRVLLVDGQLRLKRVLLTSEHDGLKRPWRLSHTSDSGLMVVGEAWKADSRSTGRVAVFRLM